MKNLYVLLYQFLPVAILLSYLLYPDVFTKVSHHPLGKLLVVLFIAIIAHRNFIHGCILCLIVVLYYHQTTASFRNFFTESFETTTISDISPSGQNYVDFMPKEASKEGSGMFEGHLAKDFTSVGEAYVQKTLPPIKRVNEAIFRKQKCNASQHITQDDRPIRRLDTLEHVYPNVEFRDGVCNPCDKSCHFTVQKRQKAEHELTLPKSSKDNIIWDMVSAFFSSSEEPVVLNNSIVASTVDQ
jgi:hypothetical protein